VQLISGERFSGTDCSNSELDDARVTDVVLDGCRLTGLAVRGGALRDVVVRDCRADLVSLSDTGLERVTFEGCVLTQADFLDARLADVKFVSCDLSGADFRGARLTGACELRGCTLDGLVGVEALRGASMPWSDIVGAAGVLAGALGIDVLED
jgi:hypothetical protein